MMIKKIFYLILASVILFAPISPAFINAQFYLSNQTNNQLQAERLLVISKDTTWKKSDNLVFNKIILITNGATLTIEKGANIVFANPRPLAGIKVLDGNIVAKGETNDKVTFSAKSGVNFIIDIESKDEESFFRYVTIKGGGSNSFFQAKIPTKKSFLNKAYAQFSNKQTYGMAALQINGGKIKIENSEFINSIGGDVKVGVGIVKDEDNILKDIYFPKVEIVNTNFSHQQAVSAQQCLEYKMIKNKDWSNCKNAVYLKNNWYGSEYGPEDVGTFRPQGSYILDGFKKNRMIVDPVILIPGILGSAFDTGGNLKIDPIWHKYDDLIESFKKNGFTEDKNLFLFPYNWRWSNAKTAILLKHKIGQIKEETKISKVDIVAHSMGGLVARAYAEKENYADNIDQLIFLGTPQKGAPKAYLMWEAGEGYNFLLERHLNHEAKEKGYNDLGKYVREKIPAVRELLPNYDYLFDVKKNKLRKYPDNYPRNEFLDNLNKKENVKKLQKIEVINFVGNIGKGSTISEIRVVNEKFANKWQNGYPEHFSNKDGNMGLIDDFGDGTVPLASAKFIPANIEKEFNVAHTDLPTKIQCDVIKELTDNFVDENLEEEDQGCKYIDKWNIPNMLLFQVFSPIDIQIIAPDGKRVGKNFVTGGYYNEINGAYYTGYKTDTEFITIPNPIDGEYKILTQGTDSGHYKIEATDISQNDSGKISEQTVTFEGETIADEEKNYSVKIKNGIELKTQVDDESGNDNNSDVGDADNANVNVSNAESGDVKIVVDNKQEEDVDNNENVGIENNDNLGDNSSNDDKHKKHKKKVERKKSERRLASINAQARNGLNSNNNEDAEKQEEKKVGENSSKKSIENNFVMGKETENKNNSNDFQSRSDNDNDKKSFVVSFGAIFLLGLVLIAGNLFGWLKIKDDKKQQDDEF